MPAFIGFLFGFLIGIAICCVLNDRDRVKRIAAQEALLLKLNNTDREKRTLETANKWLKREVSQSHQECTRLLDENLELKMPQIMARVEAQTGYSIVASNNGQQA